MSPLRQKRCSGVSTIDPFPFLGVDGPTRSVMGLAYALADAGVDIGVLPTKSYQPDEILEHKRIKFLTSYNGHKYNPCISPAKWLDMIESEFGRPDIINYHDVYDLFSCSLAREQIKRGWPYMVTPRGGLRKVAQQRDRPKKVLANAIFFKKYINRAKLIQALAIGEQDDIIDFDNSLTTSVIPNGISAELINRISKVNRFRSTGPLRIGFLGQMFVHIKGIDRLLEAIKIIQERKIINPNDAQFYIAGPLPSGADKKVVDDMIAALPNKNQLTLLGPKYGDDKWNALLDFDVFILPSRTEGMPVVGLEALSCAKPCIFTEGTNMTKIINASQSGWACEGSPQSIAHAISLAIATPSHELENMGQRGREYINSNYTWEKIVPDYIKSIIGVI